MPLTYGGIAEVLRDMAGELDEEEDDLEGVWHDVVHAVDAMDGGPEGWEGVVFRALAAEWDPAERSPEDSFLSAAETLLRHDIPLGPARGHSGKRSGGVGRKFPQQFSSPVLRVLKAVSMGTPTVMGSSDDHKVMYSGDYDLLEQHRVDVKGFQQLVKRASRVGHITDIKVGEVSEWNLLKGKYDQKAALKKLGELWQDGIVTSKEVKEVKKMVKPHLSLAEQVEVKKETRFGLMRWTAREVAQGVKRHRGKVVYLEQAMKSSGITKIDIVAWVKEKYIEVSNILLWTHGGKPYAKMPEVTRSIAEDILTYEEEGRFMKVAKRMYSVAKVKGLVQDQEDLLDILNSPLGSIYTVVSDLEVMKEFPKAVSASKKKVELDLMRDRMAKLFYGEFDDATDPKALLPRLRNVMEREAEKALKAKKLLPLSPHYKPLAGKGQVISNPGRAVMNLLKASLVPLLVFGILEGGVGSMVPSALHAEWVPGRGGGPGHMVIEGRAVEWNWLMMAVRVLEIVGIPARIGAMWEHLQTGPDAMSELDEVVELFRSWARRNRIQPAPIPADVRVEIGE